MIPTPAVVLITGTQAAGKSTVAQLLAERLPRSVHLRGDAFRRMVVGGRVDMTPDPSEAVRQLRLRHRLTATVADQYFRDEWTITQLDRGLREETPRLGLWLDTSDQTPEETVTEILNRAWQEAQIP